jgi:sulfur carrier protein
VTSLTVNGARWETSSERSIADLVAEWCATGKGVAVALNGEVVPKSTWAHTSLRDGDQIEIVTAAAGG